MAMIPKHHVTYICLECRGLNEFKEHSSKPLPNPLMIQCRGCGRRTVAMKEPTIQELFDIWRSVWAAQNLGVIPTRKEPNAGTQTTPGRSC